MLYYIFDKLPFISKLPSEEKSKRLFLIVMSIYVLLLSYSFSSFGKQINLVYNNKNFIFIPLALDISLIGYKYFFEKNKKSTQSQNQPINNINGIHPYQYYQMMQTQKLTKPIVAQDINVKEQNSELIESDSKSNNKSIENSIFSKSSSTPLINDDEDEFQEENGFEENTDVESEELELYDLPLYKSNKMNDPNDLGNDLPSYHKPVKKNIQIK